MKPILTAALGVLATLPFVAASAQGVDDEDQEAARCINLRSIDRTEVVDDENIIFYMRGDRIYVNHLKHSAMGLRKNQPFMYETTSTQLCANDMIVVLERWPGGLSRWGSAPLGRFEPIDEERADLLQNPDLSADDVVEYVDIEVEPADAQ